jgi:hypothetical protein
MQSNDGDMCVGVREKIQGDTRYLSGDVCGSPKSVRYRHSVTVTSRSAGCAGVHGYRKFNGHYYAGQHKITFVGKPDRKRIQIFRRTREASISFMY